MQHAVAGSAGWDRVTVDLDEVPLDDQPTFDMIRTTRTLGCFQIESPGQRELIGKLAPQTFDDIIIDISLFRPGPVKSDMITPFLAARHGWREPEFIHEICARRSRRPVAWSSTTSRCCGWCQS